MTGKKTWSILIRYWTADLKLHPRLAPIKAAVLPLVKKDERFVTTVRLRGPNGLCTPFNVNLDIS
jgi:glycyl-tRNA synthetase (class II)